MATPARPSSVFRFGAFALDAAKCELHKDSIALKIHPQPWRVLVLLVERAGKIVSREEIRGHLWGDNTWVDFDGGINSCIRQIRSVLGDDAEDPRYVETVSRQGYRFIFPVAHDDPRGHLVASSFGVVPQHGAEAARKASPGITAQPNIHVVPEPQLAASESDSKKVISRAGRAALSAVILGALAGVFYFPFRGKPILTEQDTIVIADFHNTTGDPVFNEALKQGLVVEFRQSPFFNILADKKISDTLQMMGRSRGESLSADLAQEVCFRSGSKALLGGYISRLGKEYLVSLTAVACNSGTILASEQTEAATREGVLKALNRAASRLRVKLGESLPSVEKYDVPVQATTTSLEALQSLSMATRVGAIEGDAAGIPLLERAVHYDPNFALAHAGLARRYINLDEPTLAMEEGEKAYELRDQVTERERLEISANYFRAKGDLDNLDKILELWKADYPREGGPHGRMCVNYAFLGQYEKALAECQEAIHLNADHLTNYENLAAVYMNLNRYQESQQVCEQAVARHMPCSILYDLAFLRGDMVGMETQLSSAAGKPGYEDSMFSAQSDTFAYYGHLRQAADFSRMASESALRSGLREVGALWEANAALRDAELGRKVEAKRGVADALQISPSRHVKVLGAIALARVGETSQARELASELKQSDPSSTLLKIYWLPVIDAAIALQQGNLPEAFDSLEAVSPYDLAQPSPNEIRTLYPVYLRGRARLIDRDGKAAAAEFQKMLDHPGIVVNFVTGALARLQLARAYVLQGDTEKARAAYQDFLTLWKDADPDIPVLKQAKAEYTKLH